MLPRSSPTGPENESCSTPYVTSATRLLPQTALHVVVKDCYIICAQMLINEGADLDAQNKDGQV